MSHQFPEVVEAARAVPEGTVLDGEIVAWDGDQPLPFNALQKRIGRKTVPKKLLLEAPVILLARPVGAYTLNVIRYTGPQGVCLALSFDTQTLPVNHCGTYNGSGVGFVTALTDPGGGTVRVAYGLTLDPAITAVAVEFTDGGNTNSFTENGAYLILLDGGRSPRRATGGRREPQVAGVAKHHAVSVDVGKAQQLGLGGCGKRAQRHNQGHDRQDETLGTNHSSLLWDNGVSRLLRRPSARAGRPDRRRDP